MAQNRLEDKVVFVSGANRGIGKALVEVLLQYQIKKVYAAARNSASLPDFNDARVVPVTLDITQVTQVQQAAALAADVQVLINNAGVLSFASVTSDNTDALQYDMQVNYFGTLRMLQHFLPVLEKNDGGIIANVLSIVSLASIAGVGGYCASKAALFSATQALRQELKAKNILVSSIFPGPIDTDMAKEFDFPKTSAETTAENILAGLASGSEDIFPDPMSIQVGELWAKDPKGLENYFANM